MISTESPDVTVLMAVHNGKSTIARAVGSIQRQTLANWRLVVVDDGSTDETCSILDNIAAADERVSVISLKENVGLANALNVGLGRVRTEWVARMDADDESLPERLQAQLEYVRANPGIDVLGTWAEIVDATGSRGGFLTRPEEHRVLVSRIWKENPFIHPSVLMRRQFLECLGGYDGHLKRAQDADLWLRGYRQFTYHNLPRPLLRYSAPAQPTLRSALYSSRVLWRAALREGRPLKAAYALRPITAATLIWIGLYLGQKSKANPPEAAS